MQGYQWQCRCGSVKYFIYSESGSEEVWGIICAECGDARFRASAGERGSSDEQGSEAMGGAGDERANVVSEEEGGTPVRRGRGRPPLPGPRPWEAEGISRALWYKRQKKAGA